MALEAILTCRLGAEVIHGRECLSLPRPSCTATSEPLEMSLWGNCINVDASSKLQKSVEHEKVMELTMDACTDGSPSKHL